MPAPKGNKFAEGNPGGGRSSEFDPKMLKQAEKACLAGFTDVELAELLGVTEVTINNWKQDHEEFRLVLKRAKETFDTDNVEQALLKSALGFKRIIEKPTKDGVVACYEEIPPNPTSLIFWLKNRRREYWKDKQELEHSGNVQVTPAINFILPEKK